MRVLSSPSGLRCLTSSLGYRAVKIFSEHQLVEVVDLQLDLIGNVFDVGDLTGGRIIHGNGVALIPFDAFFGQGA